MYPHPAQFIKWMEVARNPYAIFQDSRLIKLTTANRRYTIRQVPCVPEARSPNILALPCQCHRLAVRDSIAHSSHPNSRIHFNDVTCIVRPDREPPLNPSHE